MAKLFVEVFVPNIGNCSDKEIHVNHTRDPVSCPNCFLKV